MGTEFRIDAILPELDEMIGDGLITLERAREIMYPGPPRRRRSGTSPIERTAR